MMPNGTGSVQVEQTKVRKNLMKLTAQWLHVPCLKYGSAWSTVPKLIKYFNIVYLRCWTSQWLFKMSPCLSWKPLSVERRKLRSRGGHTPCIGYVWLHDTMGNLGVIQYPFRILPHDSETIVHIAKHATILVMEPGVQCTLCIGPLDLSKVSRSIWGHAVHLFKSARN